MRPIIAIAKATVGEAIRRRVLLIMLFIATVLLFVAPLLGVLSQRSEQTVLTGFVLGIVQLSSAVIAITLTVYMLPNEVERRTIYTILSKPVQRYQFLLGKYLGAVAALALMMGLMSCVTLIEFGVIQGNWPKGIELLQGIGMFFVQMSLLASVAMCLSTFMAPLVNFFLTFSMFIVGNLSSFTLDLAKNTQNVLAKGFFTAVHYLVPNFGNFNYTNPLVQANVQVKSEAVLLTQNCIYAVVYATVLLILSILVFDRREV